MAQRIAFSNKHDAAAQWRVDGYNAEQRKNNPAWVDLTADQLREQRCLEAIGEGDVRDMQADKDAKRADRVAKANTTKQAQIDAILDAP